MSQDEVEKLQAAIKRTDAAVGAKPAAHPGQQKAPAGSGSVKTDWALVEKLWEIATDVASSGEDNGVPETIINNMFALINRDLEAMLGRKP